MRITFSKPYEQQPIVTISSLDRFVPAFVKDVDATGFTIELDEEYMTYMSHTSNTTYDYTFSYHVFASPEAKLTVSDGTTTDVVLVIPPPPVIEIISGSVSGAPTGGSDTAPDPTPTPSTDSIGAEPTPTSEGTNEETPPPDTTPAPASEPASPAGEPTSEPVAPAGEVAPVESTSGNSTGQAGASSGSEPAPVAVEPAP